MDRSINISDAVILSEDKGRVGLGNTRVIVVHFALMTWPFQAIFYDKLFK